MMKTLTEEAKIHLFLFRNYLCVTYLYTADEITFI